MSKEDDIILEEQGRMPEPAPGKKVISFTLPQAEPPKKKTVRKPKLKEEAPAPHADFAAANQEDYKDLSPAPRRRAREVALMLLFAVAGGSTWELAETILEDTGVKGENIAFACLLARNAWEYVEKSDNLLAFYAKDWDVARFSAVDRNILRLAIAELFANKDLHNIIINEAVELGKKFSSEESGAFVNGILDRIYKCEIQAAAKAEDAEDNPDQVLASLPEEPSAVKG